MSCCGNNLNDSLSIVNVFARDFSSIYQLSQQEYDGSVDLDSVFQSVLLKYISRDDIRHKKAKEGRNRRKGYDP